MPFRALTGPKVDHIFFDEVLDAGSSKESFVESFDQFGGVSMEEASGLDGELLLTDYLLNFGEASENECPYDGFSSGVDCSDNEEERPLATLKKSLETSVPKTKKDCEAEGKSPVISEKPKESYKRVSPKARLQKSLEKSVPKTKKDCEPKGKSPVISEKLEESCKSDAPKARPQNQKKNFDDIWEEKLYERKARDRERSAKNRAMKSQKLKDLEKECTELKTSNKVLVEKNAALNEKVVGLEEQVEYLESVIANESSLSAILNTLTGNCGLECRQEGVKSTMKRKREENVECDVAEAKKKNAGVCLHISPGKMALAFCRVCHQNSMVASE